MREAKEDCRSIGNEAFTRFNCLVLDFFFFLATFLTVTPSTSDVLVHSSAQSSNPTEPANHLLPSLRPHIQRT